MSKKMRVLVAAAIILSSVGASCAAVRVAGATFGFGLTFEDISQPADAGMTLATDAGAFEPKG